MQIYIMEICRLFIPALLLFYGVTALFSLPMGGLRRRAAFRKDKGRNMTGTQTVSVLERCVDAMQLILLCTLHLVCFIALSAATQDARAHMLFWAVQTAFFLTLAIWIRKAFPYIDRQLLNHAFLFMITGISMLTRLSFEKGVHQFSMAAAGIALAFLIPFVVQKLPPVKCPDWMQWDPLSKKKKKRKVHFFTILFWKRLTWFYAILGIGLLSVVLILGSVTQGSKISYTIFGFTLQPSEFVKILFILFMAAALYWGNDLKRMASVSVTAAMHVIILVLSRDLGSALIFFVVWLFVLYYATGKWYVLATGTGIGALGAFISYHLFSHVRVRVQAFLDPWSYIDGIGYQITQSLFAISSGGLWGQGLGKGTPDKIPYVESDFIYAAIAEEFGLIFAVGLLVIFLCCFIRFLQLTLGQTDLFCRYLNFGIAIAFIFQTFLTVGGEVRFIPLTGVTLPFISYGGSSMITSIFMFGIAQCCVVLQEKHRQQRLALPTPERTEQRRKSQPERTKERRSDDPYTERSQRGKRPQSAKIPAEEPFYGRDSSYEERDRRIQKEIRNRERNRQRQQRAGRQERPQEQEYYSGREKYGTDRTYSGQKKYGADRRYSGQEKYRPERNYAGREDHIRQERNDSPTGYREEIGYRPQERKQAAASYGYEYSYRYPQQEGYGERSYGEKTTIGSKRMSPNTAPRNGMYNRNEGQIGGGWNPNPEDIDLQGFQEVVPDAYEGFLNDDETMDLRFLYK